MDLYRRIYGIAIHINHPRPIPCVSPSIVFRSALSQDTATMLLFDGILLPIEEINDKLHFR